MCFKINCPILSNFYVFPQIEQYLEKVSRLRKIPYYRLKSKVNRVECPKFGHFPVYFFARKNNFVTNMRNCQF